VYLVLVLSDERTDKLLVKFLLVIWGQSFASPFSLVLCTLLATHSRTSMATGYDDSVFYTAYRLQTLQYCTVFVFTLLVVYQLRSLSWALFESFCCPWLLLA